MVIDVIVTVTVDMVDVRVDVISVMNRKYGVYMFMDRIMTAAN